MAGLNIGGLSLNFAVVDYLDSPPQSVRDDVEQILETVVGEAHAGEPWLIRRVLAGVFGGEPADWGGDDELSALDWGRALLFAEAIEGEVLSRLPAEYGRYSPTVALVGAGKLPRTAVR